MPKSGPLRPANPRGILPVLYHGNVRFIVIGGAAGLAYGQARLTLDVDVVYARDAENIERLVNAIQPYQPYLRDAPPGLPFQFDVGTVQMGMNWTLTTTLGNLDLLGEVTGGGSYDAILPHTVVLDAYGLPIRYVTLEFLIHLKRAAGRPKDIEAIAELEVLLEERDKPNNE